MEWAKREEEYLLLLNELRVRAVIHNIRSKDRRGQLAINLLSIDILQLSIENKLIAIRPQIYGSLLAQKNEREDITMLVSTSGPELQIHIPIQSSTYLPSTRQKELIRIHTITNRTPQDRKPMKYNRRFISAVEKQLVDDVQHDRDQHQSDAIARDS